MKLTLICHTKNNFEYLPCFLAHHERFFDHIYIIDQHSDKELRHLNKQSQGIEFYKTSYSYFNTMIGVNAIIEHKNIRQQNDFLFILDVDEFIPFDNRIEFEAFLHQHNTHDAIKLLWQNGLCFSSSDQKYINDTSDLRFYKKQSIIPKLAYNLKKTPWIIAHHANHSAKFFHLKSCLFRKKANIKTVEKPLYHIPFVALENLKNKLENFDKAEFFDKLINRNKETKVLFQRIESGNISHQDLCFFTANYRTFGREQSIAVSQHDFIKNNIFSELKERILFWAQALEKCLPAPKAPSPEQHKNQALKIMGKGVILGKMRLFSQLKKRTYIDSEKIIQLR